MLAVLFLRLLIPPSGVSFADDWRANRAITTTTVVALVSTVIAQPNINRRCLYIWNNSANSAYISFAATTDAASPTAIIPTFQSFSMQGTPIYTGVISAKRNAGTGRITAWECMP